MEFKRIKRIEFNPGAPLGYQHVILHEVSNGVDVWDVPSYRTGVDVLTKYADELQEQLFNAKSLIRHMDENAESH